MLIRVTMVFAGLCIALLAWGLAWLVAGGGHGWVAPVEYSLYLFILYPVVLLRAGGWGPSAPALDLVLLAAAVLLDFALAAGTWKNEYQYFMRDPAHPITLIWIALWLGWQAVTIANVVRRLKQARRMESGSVSAP